MALAQNRRKDGHNRATSEKFNLEGFGLKIEIHLYSVLRTEGLTGEDMTWCNYRHDIGRQGN